MGTTIENRRAYAIAGVDDALRAAAMRQLEGALTVTGVADRLGIALPSPAPVRVA